MVTGSITLCDTLIIAGLVDEYRLFVYPVVQGRGPGINPTADAECGQGTGRLADVPFHGMEPVTTIGDMSDAQTLAGRQQVLHSLREQRAQWDLKWIGRDVKVSASCGGVAPPPCLP